MNYFKIDSSKRIYSCSGYTIQKQRLLGLIKSNRTHENCLFVYKVDKIDNLLVGQLVTYFLEGREIQRSTRPIPIQVIYARCTDMDRKDLVYLEDDATKEVVEGWFQESTSIEGM